MLVIGACLNPFGGLAPWLMLGVRTASHRDVRELLNAYSATLVHARGGPDPH